MCNVAQTAKLRSIGPVNQVVEAPSTGRRERKKQATHALIKHVAVALALQHGVDKVTVEQISDAADVSPRTFFNYFASKEEALLDDRHEAIDQWRALLGARPRGESPLHALRCAIVDSEYVRNAEDRRTETLDRHRLIQQDPSLLPRYLARYSSVERMFTEAMAQRLGVDAKDDLRPALLAALATSVVRVASNRWTVDDRRPLHEVVGEVFALVESGIPDNQPEEGGHTGPTRQETSR